jgi:acyl dehydratase
MADQMSAIESAVDGSSVWHNRSATCTLVVTGEMIDAFAALSGDTAAIHLDDQHARRAGFTGRVAHGLLLGALVSRVIGTELPGAAGVLHGVSLSFRNPCYVGDLISITVSVREYIASIEVLTMDVRVTRADGTLLAKGQAQSGFLKSDHEPA